MLFNLLLSLSLLSSSQFEWEIVVQNARTQEVRTYRTSKEISFELISGKVPCTVETNPVIGNKQWVGQTVTAICGLRSSTEAFIVATVSDICGRGINSESASDVKLSKAMAAGLQGTLSLRISYNNEFFLISAKCLQD